MGEAPPSLPDEGRILDRLQLLEERIRRIEARLEIEPIRRITSSDSSNAAEPLSTGASSSAGRSLELGIGEFGLGWIGTVILFLGIVFLMAYAFAGGHKVVACLLGYAASAGLYVAALYWRKGVAHLSHATLASSLLMFYYVTARLHFFSDSPVITNGTASLVLLAGVAAAIFAFGMNRRSQALAGLGVVLGIYTALLSGSGNAIFAVGAVSSALAAFLAFRARWRFLFLVTIPLVYLAHLLWLAGNPLSAHVETGLPAHQYNLIWLFLYGVILALPMLLLGRERPLDGGWIGAIFVNTGGFSLAVSAVCFVHFPGRFASIYLILALGCLVLSIAHWMSRHEELVPSIYACFGYLALSIALYGFAGVPAAFLWLSLQSLLVVSMALWFRSRLLVVSNSLIYVGILLAYLMISRPSDWVNFSFAAVALASARIMNWQKQRLALQTDMLRNTYLVLAFLFVLYSIYRAVPSQYVSLSWTAAAVGYFILSVTLRNIKYRWMSMFTMLITIVYLFVVDLARLSSITRVAAFLFLGVIALLISVFYATKSRQDHRIL